MTNTPNKNYPLQTTGTNVGTWGTVLNSSVFSVIDNNLGGTLALGVGGSSNINLTSAQASYLIHNLTGALTGNIQYIFPALGGFYAINNQTTGAYTLTVAVTGGSGGIVVPQGTAITIYIDATTPAVYGFTGSQAIYSATAVGGSANALTVSTTVPANFTLVSGVTIINFTPVNYNTTTATLTSPDGSTHTLQKITYGGLANLIAGDLIPGVPIIAQWNGTVWICENIPAVGYLTEVSTNQSVGFANTLTPYVNTAAVTYTIAQTTTLVTYWNISVNAAGGAAIITPYATDVINVNGVALTAGASYTIPQGSSGQITTDAAGNLYINFLSGIAGFASQTANTVFAAPNGSSGTPTFRALVAADLPSVGGVTPPQGRLTLQSNIPVMTANTTAVSSVYYTPYIGNQIPIYSGSAFVEKTFAQLTMTLDATNNLSGKIYDLFIFLNSGTVTIASGPAWTNSTTRSAAITQVQGLWVNNATITLTNNSTTYASIPANQATYVGSVYCTANAQTGMNFLPAAASGGSNPFMGLYNAYNRVKISASSQDSTSTWTNATTTWRATDNNNNNRISILDGLAQSPVTAEITGGATNSGVNLDQGFIGVNQNSTSATPTIVSTAIGVSSVSVITITACGKFLPVLGLSYYQGMEVVGGSTLTFYGVLSTWQVQSMSVNYDA